MNSTIDDRIFDPLKKFMTPAREKAPVTDRKGTYNGWGQAPNSMVIDHLFVRNMKCLSYRTLDGDYGVPYISDHYPIEIVVAPRWKPPRLRSTPKPYSSLLSPVPKGN